MKIEITRKWINQPSTSQQLHKLHGTQVLCAENEIDSPLFVTIYFLNGPVISMRVLKICLSDGWIFRD